MVTCPWCGTSYASFQSNCSRCGGVLPPPEVQAAAEDIPTAPPPAPRAISNSYAWKLMGRDGGAIAGMVFGLLGIVFTPIGAILCLGSLVAFSRAPQSGGLETGGITALVGLPFLFLGLVFLAAGASLLIWRYRSCRRQAQVLKWGDAVLGCVSSLEQNYHVRVRGRFPWKIAYTYSYRSQSYTGQVSTLNPPKSSLQAGKSVYVLVLPNQPALSSLYPHP